MIGVHDWLAASDAQGAWYRAGLCNAPNGSEAFRTAPLASRFGLRHRIGAEKIVQAFARLEPQAFLAGVLPGRSEVSAASECGQQAPLEAGLWPALGAHHVANKLEQAPQSGDSNKSERAARRAALEDHISSTARQPLQDTLVEGTSA